MRVDRRGVDDVGTRRRQVQVGQGRRDLHGGWPRAHDPEVQRHLTAFCVGPTIADNRLIAAVAPVPKAKVAPDGRFLAVYRPSSTTITLRGRLHGRRVTGGKVEISFSTCAGSTTFAATRG